MGVYSAIVIVAAWNGILRKDWQEKWRMLHLLSSEFPSYLSHSRQILSLLFWVLMKSTFHLPRLLFQHRTTDEENGAHNFYVQSRQNRCVGCGEEGHFLRYKVVPSCYRRHFPVHMKSHRSHDVVLLCLDCHHEAQIVGCFKCALWILHGMNCSLQQKSFII